MFQEVIEIHDRVAQKTNQFEQNFKGFINSQINDNNKKRHDFEQNCQNFQSEFQSLTTRVERGINERQHVEEIRKRYCEDEGELDQRITDMKVRADEQPKIIEESKQKLLQLKSEHEEKSNMLNRVESDFVDHATKKFIEKEKYRTLLGMTFEARQDGDIAYLLISFSIQNMQALGLTSCQIALRIDGGLYSVAGCQPAIQYDDLIASLNDNKNFGSFIILVRNRFKNLINQHKPRK
ncbi:predicted protein [Naegleria gruberi]|uniref:Kinetochore protein SPC25 n=1 Tax=Naegleria gruberi TaxID=5762 RepID=D2V4P4_NAEGR|nr:uncharacterized protein NAEGRDRAFT_63861 [Naegleria gruberi]EFC47967.1 predicted protein [Naegleria gruberi]|eukprot:XP_002680711.1 predicted protein [Naegleria gruberi strain NEG-M]